MNGLRWLGRLFSYGPPSRNRTRDPHRKWIYLQAESLEPRCAPALAITTTTLLDSDVGMVYSQTIDTTGGIGSVTFSSTGTLPTGLTLSTSGVLAGTPTATGSYSFMVMAADTGGDNASQDYAVTINPAIALSVPNLPTWTAGLAFSQTITAAGGTGSLTIEATGAPPGLKMSTAGILSGVPVVPGAFSL